MAPDICRVLTSAEHLTSAGYLTSAGQLTSAEHLTSAGYLTSAGHLTSAGYLTSAVHLTSEVHRDNFRAPEKWPSNHQAIQNSTELIRKTQAVHCNKPFYLPTVIRSGGSDSDAS